MDIFRGELVRLTALSRDGLPVYTRWFRDYDVQRLLGPLLIPMTDEAEASWYERASAASNGSSHTFSIRTLADDVLIGNCSLFSIDHKNRNTELGIVIGEQDYWGRGYGSDAMRVLLGFGFGELNLHRIDLRVYDFNPRGIRAYEKLGFVHEGRKREAIWREGAYHDVLFMSILEEEWTAKNT